MLSKQQADVLRGHISHMVTTCKTVAGLQEKTCSDVDWKAAVEAHRKASDKVHKVIQSHVKTPIERAQVLGEQAFYPYASMNVCGTKKEIIAPVLGWQADTLYLVRVAFNHNNPVHEAYLKVGFLNADGKPGTHTELFSNTYDEVYGLSEVHYLAPVKVLHSPRKGGASADPPPICN